MKMLFFILVTNTLWATTKMTEGTFLKIDIGDYFHLEILDKKGKEHSFWCLKYDCEVLNNEKNVGRKIKVFWETRNELIPESGGKMKVDCVKKVEFSAK